MYFNKFEIETKLDKVQIIEKLKEITFTDKLPLLLYGFDCKGKTFTGKIFEDKFDILPIVEGRNSFIPVIRGEIENEKQCKIKVKLRLHFVVIFLLFCLTVFIIIPSINAPQGSWIFLMVTYGFTFYLYNQECKKIKAIFSKHFTIQE